MKKKLLTIFAAMALVVAMLCSVVACTPGKTPGRTDNDDDDDDTNTIIDLSDDAEASATAFGNALQGTLKTALDKSDEKSYDATIFVKVKVGEGTDAIDVDVKLHVAATFGATNSGLVDVIVGGTSYLSLFAEGNTVYIGEALTQEDMNWFKVDDVKVIGKFFPELIKVFNEEELADETDLKNNKTTYFYKNFTDSMVNKIVGLLPTVVKLLYVTDQKDGVMKETLSDGSIKYTNNVTFAMVQQIMPLLSMFELTEDKIYDMLDGIGIGSLVDTICSIIFGGDLHSLLGGTIDPEAAAAIQLNYTTKGNQLLGLELNYANDFAFGDASEDSDEPVEKTAVAVSFGLENVNVTTSSKTTIVTKAISDGIKNAKEPAIKLSIEAEVPGKDVGATVEAYVIPKVVLDAHEYYSVPTKYAQTYYTDSTGNKKLVDKNHECEKKDGYECVHEEGELIDMEEGHRCYTVKGECVHYNYQEGLIETGHKCLNRKCNHYIKLDEFDFSATEAYAIATNSKGDVTNLGCDVDVSQLKDDGNGEIVLRIELAGLYALLGIEDTTNLPTSYKKTFVMWEDEEEVTPDEPEEEEVDVQNATLLADGTTVENTIDQVFDAFSGGFNVTKVLGLLNPILDFAKEILNDVLKPNISSDETTKVATLDVAKVLEALVANETISGSDKLNINKEGNVTKYLKDLAGVAGLVDNIMRHTDESKKDLKPGEAYKEADLVALVKKYAGITISDDAFDDTVLLLTGIRGKKGADDGVGFTAELKSEGVTVLKLTLKADIIDAASVTATTVIDREKFNGAELEKVPVQATEEDGTPIVDDEGNPVYVQKVDKDGEPVVDAEGNPVYETEDGEALNNINDMMEAILKAYEAKGTAETPAA